MTSVETETSCMQARESASRDMLSVKDAYIAALCTELRGKDRMLQAQTRVCTPPYYSHHNASCIVYYMYIHWRAGVSQASVRTGMIFIYVRSMQSDWSI